MTADESRQGVAAELVRRLLIGVSTQSWLASMVIHLTIFTLLALILGTVKVAQVIAGHEFIGVETIEPVAVELEPFPLSATSIEPTILDTEPLTAPDPATDLIESRTIGTAEITADSRGDSDSLPALGGGASLAVPTDASLGALLKPSDGIGGSSIDPGPAQPFWIRDKKRRDGATKASERAVSAALNWLARHQNSNGSWSLDHTSRCKSGFCSGPGRTQADAGGTALALLPFLAAGQTHQSEGIYRRQIAGGINYLLKIQAASGDLSAGSHQMYAHGLATIALCEAYGMTRDSRLGSAAQAAIRFIETGQNGQGSWRYSHGAADSDTSVFGWQVMALKSGQMAGLTVRLAALDASRRYLNECANGRYGSEFGYQPGSRSTEAMSAVGLLMTQYLGARRSDPVVVGGIEYLTKHPPAIDSRNTYYWYYATQAMHNVPGPQWDAWNRQMRRILIESQERSGCAAGSWDPMQPTDDVWGSAGGRLMVTSLSTLTLEVYYRYLPLYQLDQGE